MKRFIYSINVTIEYKQLEVILMELSANNQLKGKVTGVDIGAVMANIKIEVSEPNTITAVITKESAERLGLKEGDDVSAIIKSTEVIVGK